MRRLPVGSFLPPAPTPRLRRPERSFWLIRLRILAAPVGRHPALAVARTPLTPSPYRRTPEPRFESAVARVFFLASSASDRRPLLGESLKVPRNLILSQ